MILLFHLKFKGSISLQGSGLNIRNTMYTDSPSRFKFAYAVVRDTLRKVGAEPMPISIIKIWCRNNRSIMSQPLSNDCLVNIIIINLCT